MKYTDENMPLLTPPCDSIPWYITAFQSSPVRICRGREGEHPGTSAATGAHTHAQGETAEPRAHVCAHAGSWMTLEVAQGLPKELPEGLSWLLG